jgi:hypothetical protein
MWKVPLLLLSKQDSATGEAAVNKWRQWQQLLLAERRQHLLLCKGKRWRKGDEGEDNDMARMGTSWLHWLLVCVSLTWRRRRVF